MTTHRRRFLRLCGVAGIGAIAGCSDDSQDAEGPTESSTPTEPSTATNPPQVSWNFNYDSDPTDSGEFGGVLANGSDTGLLTIYHDGGDSVSDGDAVTLSDDSGNETVSLASAGLSEMTAGDSVSVQIDSTDTIQITYTDSGGSSTIGAYTGE